MILDGSKFACDTCVRGHRASKCQHIDRPLQKIIKKGRPVRQCQHCRSLRQSHSVHTKCDCGAKAQNSSLESMIEADSERCCCNDGQPCICAYKKVQSVLDTWPGAGFEVQGMSPAHDSGAASWDENHSDGQSQLHGSEHLMDLSNLLYSRHDQSVDGASADDRFDVTWSLASTNAMTSCFPFQGQMDMGPGIPIGSTNIAGGVSAQYIELDKPIFNGIDPFSDPDTALGWSVNSAHTIDGRNLNPYFAMTENDQERGSYTPDFGQSLENNTIEETRAVTNFTEDFM